MRKGLCHLSTAALAAGIAGASMRRMELKNAFEQLSGLPVRGAPETTRLIILTIAVIVLFAVFSIVLSRKYMPPENSVSFIPAGVRLTALYSLIGAVWLIAAVKYALDIRSAGAFPTAQIYFTALSVLSALSLPAFAVSVNKKPSGSLGMLFSIVPALFMCFWLVLFYRENAANPVLLSYCYQCLALISAALSFYFVSGCAFGKPALGKALFSFLCAGYFCFVTLADNSPLELKAIFALSVVFALANAAWLLHNMKKPPEKIPEE